MVTAKTGQEILTIFAACVKKAFDSVFQQLIIDYAHILPFDLIM